jgi:hypothetical protein
MNSTVPAFIGHPGGQRHRRLPDVAAQFLGDGRGRRLFHHLLMAALQRAVALAQMDHVAEPVAQHLDLDMPGVADEPLEIERIVAEGCPRLGRRGGEDGRQVGQRRHHLHAAAAAAGGRLDHHRQADPFGRPSRLVGVVHLFRPGQRRHAEVAGQGARLQLVAHAADLVGPRSDEDDPMRRAQLGKLRRLGQEAIAGMQGVRPGAQGGGDHQARIEIASGGRRRPDADGAIGHPGRQAVAVGFGDRQHRLDPESPGGADDADGDFPSVGDQHARDAHRSLLLRSLGHWPDPKQNLTELHELGILDADLVDDAAELGRDRIEDLHHLDQPDRGSGFDGGPDGDEGGGSGIGPVVKDPDDGRLDVDRGPAGGLRGRRVSGRLGPGGRHRRHYRRCGRGRRRHRLGGRLLRETTVRGRPFAKRQLRMAEVQLQKVE